MTTRPEVLDALALKNRLYAIVDTAGDREAYEHMISLGARARCLYYGAEGARYAAIAPWLVCADAAFCDWLWDVLSVREPYWGVFLISQQSAAAVARQLRRWLTVKLPEGDLMRFRFYDARVLFDFLSASSADELHSFYGDPIEAFARLDETTQQLVVYARADAPVDLPMPDAPIVVPADGRPDETTEPERPLGVATYFPLGPARSGIR